MDMIKHLKQFWTWRTNDAWGWLESALITILLLFICYFIFPKNPLFIKEAFPWPWIAPLIIVFQYGFGPSLLSMGIIMAFSIYLKNVGLVPLLDFQTYLLSGMTFILIASLFSTSWMRRVLFAESLSQYMEERLKSLSRSYQMLRISTDYLEQNIFTKPYTLRMALVELEKLNLIHEDQLSQEVAYSFLQIVSQFCSVNALGIYLYHSNVFDTVPFAQIGSMEELKTDDPLIKKCMESEEIHYVGINKIEDISDCAYLASVPLITSENRLLGVLVIKDMPFWNLNEDTLRVLSILVFYFIKQVVVEQDTSNFLREYPGCTIDFVTQLQKLMRLKQKMGMDSAIVAVLVDKKLSQYNVIDHLKSQQRMLDSYWSMSMEQKDVFIVLMPLVNATGIHGYISRTTDYLTSDVGLILDNKQLQIRSFQLHGDDPLMLMNEFIHFIKEGQYIE